MTNEKTIEVLEKIKKRLLPSMVEEEEAFNRAINALRFINEYYPESFKDYLRGYRND